MRILIPVDGSEPSLETLDWAIRTLDKTTSSFVLVSVIDEPMIAEYRIEDAMEVLDKARRKLEAGNARVEKAEYIMGDPVDRICQVARDENVDQILVGSHGRSGVSRAFMGSVSEGLLKHCDRPVMIFRESRKVFG